MATRTRHRFRTAVHYIDSDAQTVFTSLRGHGVSVEAWIELKDSARWGVRVRAGGETFNLGEGQAPSPQKT